MNFIITELLPHTVLAAASANVSDEFADFFLRTSQRIHFTSTHSNAAVRKQSLK